MKKTFFCQHTESLALNFEGNGTVDFTKSENDALSINIVYDNDKLVFEESNINNSYELKVINPENKQNAKDFIDNLVSFKNFTNIVNYLAKNSQNNTNMTITVELPSQLENFSFKLNNGASDFKYLNSKIVSIKGNNLGVLIGNDTAITDSNIKINNSNLDISLNKHIKTMNIKSNNGNVTFTRTDNSNVGISVKGNNIRTEGSLSTDNNVVFCKLNNGQIKVN